MHMLQACTIPANCLAVKLNVSSCQVLHAPLRACRTLLPITCYMLLLLLLLLLPCPAALCRHPNITTAFHFVTWNFESAAAAANELAPAGSSLLEIDSNAANAVASAVDSRSYSPEHSMHAKQGALPCAAGADAAAAFPAAHSTSSTSAGAVALLNSSCRQRSSSSSIAAAAAVPKVDDQSWSAADGSTDQQPVVVPIGALGGLQSAELNRISCVSDGVAVGPPAATAAAAGDSWSSTADGFHSSISNAGSSLAQPGSDTTLAAAAAAAAAPVVATTDSQPVQLWPSVPVGKQRHFVLLTPLQLEINPNRHTQQQQQQQRPLPSQTAGSSSVARTAGGSKRPPPCEAQTWLVMEYCDGG
jgi:hypothetical protein